MENDAASVELEKPVSSRQSVRKSKHPAEVLHPSTSQRHCALRLQLESALSFIHEFTNKYFLVFSLHENGFSI